MQADKKFFRTYVYTEWMNSINTKDIYAKLLKVWKDDTPNERTIYRWISDFKSGKRSSFEDAERSGRPCSSSTPDLVESVHIAIEADHRLSLRDLAYKLSADKETIRKILKDYLYKRKICSAWIPYEINADHMQQRKCCAQGILTTFHQLGRQEMLRRFVTTDETWVNFKPIMWKSERKVWCDGDKPRPRAPQLTPNVPRVMLLMAFTGSGQFAIQTTELRETVDSERYVEFVDYALNKLRRDRHGLPTSDIIWQQDNARPHTSRFTQSFFDRRGVFLQKQSPYSPDLNQCDKWLFKMLKKHLKKQTFSSADQIKQSARQFMMSLDSEKLELEFDKFINHCSKVISVNGDYTIV